MHHILNRFSWPTDPLNLALYGSNEIVCVSYWGFIPKVHFKFCLILLYIIEPSKWEHDKLSVLYKILSKSISTTNYKTHFYNVFQLLLSITLDKRSKILNILTKVIEIQNTFRSHC